MRLGLDVGGRLFGYLILCLELGLVLWFSRSRVSGAGLGLAKEGLAMEGLAQSAVTWLALYWSEMVYYLG